VSRPGSARRTARAARLPMIPFWRSSAIQGCARRHHPGRRELGAPDWRGNVPGKPMSDQEVTDVVAWLASRRVQTPDSRMSFQISGNELGVGSCRMKPTYPAAALHEVGILFNGWWEPHWPCRSSDSSSPPLRVDAPTATSPGYRSDPSASFRKAKHAWSRFGIRM
jgi:hypothetical protein